MKVAATFYWMLHIEPPRTLGSAPSPGSGCRNLINLGVFKGRGSFHMGNPYETSPHLGGAPPAGGGFCTLINWCGFKGRCSFHMESPYETSTHLGDAPLRWLRLLYIN
mgnify:CR=1 FL=1